MIEYLFLELRDLLKVINYMANLRCGTCGREIEVPKCCDTSMILNGEYLMCCCSKECGYQSIPECCGKKMNYMG